MSEVFTEAASGGRQKGQSSAREALGQWLGLADVRLDGDRPWDIRVLRPEMPERVLAGGSLALGESYMDGDWHCERLDELFTRLIRARLGEQVHSLSLAWHVLRAKLFNLQNPRRAWQVGREHYDLGNDFYAAMLDARLTYTCAYWQGRGDQAGACTLDEAQEAKLDLVCRKLGLRPGMRVLDIGCGWGSFMGFAAERYGVQCVGVTISEQQAGYGRQRYAHLPVEFRLQDYRELDERFDRVVSLGMFEHVGHKNYGDYMAVARRCLADDGLFLLHTIGRNDTADGTDPWIDRYVFPNGELPSIARLGKAMEPHFVVEDLHNFGADYDHTLMAWHRNFEAAWPRFAAELGDRFYRRWRYYLLCCAGAFRARDIQLWQWVLSPRGVAGGYRRVS
ncbi:cyclopropane fatty acyl phospholipid synthase [Ideonella sp. B7]|uniref:cyclopropane fatty acyl phospholipid synthase n=1 Tax=Ideonella benzenivorans TaxID=2831643 RepID=UPI001CECC5B8|nr:cyclopropane fatty acyl phospholipid synthase [Ideonella benzenivorans]MCA6217186.1 cyclopropane fatty acyl phospholipid synthase [Ideonella benzenivorans]